MAFTSIEPRLGIINISNTVSANSAGGATLATGIAIGTVVRANDPTLGMGEFIFLQGVASTVVGSLVTYNPQTGVTALSPNTANLAQPVAVAMAACNATTLYGWYQIEGMATIKKTAVKVNPNVAVFQSATTGRIMSTAASGKQVLGARSANAATVASATSTVVVTVNRPHMQGQVI